MKEVNKILAMTEQDSKVAVSDPITCEFSLEEPGNLEPLLRKYASSLSFNSCCGKSEPQVKEEPS